LNVDGIEIRTAGPQDAEAVTDIYMSLALHHASLAPRHYRVPDRNAVRERFGRFVADGDPANLHLVAIVDGRVVAQLDGWGEPAVTSGSTRVQLAAVSVGLAVLDGYRGRGIGSALLAEAEAWARDRGLDEIRLEVAVENAAAERLYRRLGYEASTTLLAKRLR
jgi:ribosomal protein S18 acetylase RimI-like enzyme